MSAGKGVPLRGNVINIRTRIHRQQPPDLLPVIKVGAAHLIRNTSAEESMVPTTPPQPASFLNRKQIAMARAISGVPSPGSMNDPAEKAPTSPVFC